MHVNKVNLQPFNPRSAANDIIRSRSFRLDRLASNLEKKLNSTKEQKQIIIFFKRIR